MAGLLDGVLIAVFCIGLFVPVYSYFIFPAILWMLARFNVKRFKSDEDFLPSVTLIISAYNEVGIIREKLENSLALDYPRDKLHVIVVNDGSKDGTDGIIEEYAASGIEHCRVEGRLGKNLAINKAWPLVKGDLVVFSDANSIYRTDAVRRMAARFADARVGCVCGELRYTDAGRAHGEGLYWRYEQYLKRLESRMGQLLVLNGSIFAIRKGLFSDLHPLVANDFQIAADIAARGFFIIYEPAAVAEERAADSMRAEFGRKVRIVARGFQGMVHCARRFRGLRLFMLLSHKALRWLAWLALLSALVANALLLRHPVFRWTFAVQTLFYLTAAAGPWLSGTGVGILGIPYYFCMVNAAAAAGFVRFATGRQRGSWEPVRPVR